MQCEIKQETEREFEEREMNRALEGRGACVCLLVHGEDEESMLVKREIVCMCVRDASTNTVNVIELLRTYSKSIKESNSP